MRTFVHELKEGCILAADVFSKTNRPIIPKKTVLSTELIEILKVFLIKEVEVEKTLVNGLPFTPKLVKEQDVQNTEIKTNLQFTDLFLIAKKDFKKEFQKWQSGMPVDVSQLRAIILPLIDKFEDHSTDILSLHHFSTKHEYPYAHSLAVGIISAFIAKKMNYKKGDLMQIALAGCLSDCGMAKISASILNKKTTLTVEEYEEIKKHPTYSYQMIRNSPLLKEAAKVAILQHHERLDGSGYPFGEKADRIHPYAKILAIADIFHAMTSERIYKPKHSPFKVLEMIQEDMFGEFDLSALQTLSSALMIFSNGSKVRLSNGQEAEIIFTGEKHSTRPLIKLLDTQDIIALEKNRHLFIEEVLT